MAGSDNPFVNADAWRRHPLLNNTWRHIAPGFFIGLTAFGVFYAYDKATSKKPAKHLSAKDTFVRLIEEDAEQAAWWLTDCDTLNAFKKLKRENKDLAKQIRIACCHDVDLGKFASMKDVKSVCDNSPDFDFDEVYAANVEWVKDNDAYALDFA